VEVEDSGVSNEESAAPVFNGEAVQNEDAVEESKSVATNGDADDDLDSNDYGEESKPADF
jgi:hypothetical protein